MEGGGEKRRKAGPILIDYDKLLRDSDDEPPPVVVIQEAKEKSEPPVGETMERDENGQCLDYLSQKGLVEQIGRMKNSLSSMSSKLPDGGAKYRAKLEQLEAERERRLRMEDENKCKKVISLSDESNCNGVTGDLSRSRAPPSGPASIFGLRFCSILDDKKQKETEKPTKCFGEELSTLNRSDNKNISEHVPFAAQKRQKIVSSSRQAPFKSPSHLSVNIDNRPRSNGEHWGRDSSNPSLCLSNKDVSGCSGRKGSATRGQPPPNTRRNSRKLVLLDEEEEELEVDVVDKAEQVGRRCFIDSPNRYSKETRIYYPFRDDPEAVQICYSDMECLAPESYLSSPIMNFYIRYLQKLTSPRARKKCDYHIFNTYFYEKLKQDVLTKADKETPFLKFRRWWKGVNIFETSYIFLPVHENQHWSLVIICIPDKQDDLRPIVLHLDSLGLHNSKSIFNNVKSFLIEEWKFLKQEPVLPELPIADHIWDKLSRRICEKAIEVPQQKNEYDCGLFVLYFMERFLKEAPVRLKREDLEMFGKQWFEPKEASSLRRKIRDLLREEFKNANEGTS